MPPKDYLSRSPGKPDPAPDANIDADADANLARAFQELARGERTASVMETQLTALERKIDDLFATIATPEVLESRKNKESTETVGNVSGTRDAQSTEK